jgi:tripartite-type tricarboxylate transporter receptor subunit TctC
MAMSRWLAVGVALTVWAGGSSAQTGSYPTKPVRWVVPFASGGGTDVVVRPIAQKMSERLGQSILYDNRGGAGGVVAGQIVARAAPDGYTLLVAAVAVMTVNPTLMKMPFDSVKDFIPITKFASVPNILAVRASFAPQSVQEMIAHAKSNPGKVIWALSGVGSGGHLAMEMVRLETDIDVVRVFYKGAGPATVAMLSNEADLLFANPGVFMAHLKSGRLRALAVAAKERIEVLPEVPTMIESGFPGFESGSWYGLAAPAGTPAPIIERLYRDSAQVLKDPDVVARLTLDGATAVGNSPQQFAQEIKDDIVRWAKVIKAAHIQVQH